MAEWTEMFSKDPDLGIMEQGYMKLKSQSKKEQPGFYLSPLKRRQILISKHLLNLRNDRSPT
jgi:hypothetical protein